MRISMIGICRGSGKVFLALRIDDLQDDSTVEMNCTSTKDGSVIPCSLYPYEAESSFLKDAAEFNYVATIPQFSITQKLNFIEYNQKTDSISEASLSVNYQTAKWLSRLNYRMKRKITNLIRDYDIGRNSKEGLFKFIKCIPDTQDNILSVSITLPSSYKGQLELKAFTYKCEPLEVRPILMGDRYRPVDWRVKGEVRSVLYSIRIPKEEASYTFVLYHNGVQVPGFGAIDVVHYKNLIREGMAVYNNASASPVYHDWFMNHRVTRRTLDIQRQTVLSEQPMFSIIVPLYQTPLPLLDEMVSSVIGQSYPNWELLLVNASRDNQDLFSAVTAYCNEYPNIKHIVLDSNLGITENTNFGIDAAQGDFVCFLDHDDTIEADLLFEYASAINEHPDTDLLYCDEDHLTADNRFVMPYFKSDFSIDLERCNNYVCHMLTVRKSLLDALPRPTKEFDGAQDHNMTLMVSEHARYIHHVPKILYHWRMAEHSTAADPNSKPYAFDAGERAVRAHLDRLNLPAHIQREDRPFTFRVFYEPPSPLPKVSIIIPSKNNLRILQQCIDSIVGNSTYTNYEIIIVDNGSDERDVLDYYRNLTEQYNNIVIVYSQKEFNYSKLINDGVNHAEGEYLLLLNNDTSVITQNWLEQLVGLCSRADVGIAGARLWYPDDTIQHAGVRIFIGAGDNHFTEQVADHLNAHLPKSNWGYYALSDCQMNLSAVTGACMMLRKDVFEQAGRMNEDLAVAYNDVDLCLTVRELGYQIVYTPYVNLYHYEMFSRGDDAENPAKQLRLTKEACYMYDKWVDRYIEGDPFYNKNLRGYSPYYTL